MDQDLETLRLQLAPLVADAAVFDGWGATALADAAATAGVNPDLAALAFSGGPMVMIEALAQWVDAAMIRALPAQDLARLSVRTRIRELVAFRLQAQKGREEALRRALSILAMPQNLPAALKLGWRSADTMWRLAGDTAADLNHYTKRATLAAVYGATLAVFVDDTSADKAETMAFLDRRIAGIMRFEKAKARFIRPEMEHFSVARFLGRLRYPAR